MRREYEFVPVTRADYPMLRRWLSEPHVRAWWGTPEGEIALMERDLESPSIAMRIVRKAGVPFAYVQHYDGTTGDMPHYADMPKGARAVDTFIGEPSHLGRGHAAGFLRQLAEDLLDAGHPAVVIDPSVDNPRAIRAYRAAGFEGDEVRPNEDGDPVHVLRFRDRRR